MIILAYLIEHKYESWRGADIRVKMVVPDEEASQSAKDNLALI